MNDDDKHMDYYPGAFDMLRRQQRNPFIDLYELLLVSHIDSARPFMVDEHEAHTRARADLVALLKDADLAATFEKLYAERARTKATAEPELTAPALVVGLMRLGWWPNFDSGMLRSVLAPSDGTIIESSDPAWAEVLGRMSGRIR